RLRAQKGQRGPFRPGVAEGVVHVVEFGADPPASHGPQQPLVFVVPDVGQVPDEGRHQGRVLTKEIGGGHGSEEIEGPLPRRVQLPRDQVLVVHRRSPYEAAAGSGWSIGSSAGHLDRATKRSAYSATSASVAAPPRAVERAMAVRAAAKQPLAA